MEVFCIDKNNVHFDFEQVIDLLPFNLQTRVLVHRNREDQINSLLGYLMVRLCFNLKKINLEKLDFKYNKYGKPYLVNNDFYFNISHSDKFVVCSVATEEVGVDIEDLTKNFFTSEIINSVFNTEEIANIEDEKLFFKLWTIKESYLKYNGIGLKDLKECFFDAYKDINVIDNIRIYSYEIEKSYLSVATTENNINIVKLTMGELIG